MKKHVLARAVAALLALALLVLPVSALTVDQTRELLRTYYVDPVPQEVLDQPTIQDMLDALGDPYTEYLTAEEYAQFMASMSDSSLVGIGITLPAGTLWEEGLVIEEVLAGGPAQRAGLQSGDVIVAVDRQSTLGLTTDQAVELIRGEEGTRVTITYLRDHVRHSVTLKRETVVIAATTGQVLDGGVGLIQCATWGMETIGHFRELIQEMDGQVGCWLIDLRDNTGGVTDAAAEVAGFFCGPGNKLQLRMRSDSPLSLDSYAYEFYETDEAAITDKPVVILVNGYSASASEAFTAAMRDYGRAVVVGERTFGKGVAQGIWNAESDPEYFPEGDALKITLARFYAPLGNTNDTLGLIPDFPCYGPDPQEAEALALTLAQGFADAPENWLAYTDELLTVYIASCAFEDTQDHPYARSIAALAAYGLVNGKGDGLFHGEDTLTRAELAQMLVNALNSWIPQNTTAFTDVPSDAWYADAVNAIAAQGFMEGTGEGRFSPEGVLTHQELFAVLGRLSRWLNDDVDLEARRTAELSWYIDILDDYADWAKPSVWLLSCALENDAGRSVNLLWDYPENIDPTAPATRAEAAEALYSIFYYLDILP